MLDIPSFFEAFCPSNADEWIQIVFHGLLAAGLAQTVSSMLLSAVAFALHGIRALPKVSAFRSRRNTSRQNEATQRSYEQVLRQEEERRARENYKAEKKADASRRRDDARMRCFMLYDRHSTTLAERFPRERLQEYFNHYMSDSSPPEVVEERARMLAALIDEWVAQDKTRQKKEFRTLEELAAFFQKQRDEVAGLSYDTDIKDSFLTNINIQEEQAVRRFLAS